MSIQFSLYICKRKMCKLFLFIISTIILWCFSEANYVIFAPRMTLHSVDYQILVTKTNDDLKSIQVDLKFDGEKDGDIYEETVDVGSESYVHTFKLNDREIIENYILTAKLSGSKHNQTFDIFTINKKYSALIHTERFEYHAGAKVKFRVFIVDIQTRPCQPGVIKITVTNEIDKIVYAREFSGLDDTVSDGFYGDDFEIPSVPVLGKYKMKVTAEDVNIGDKTFVVTESVLPGFIISMNAKSATLYSENSLKLEVFVKYPSAGHFAEGKAIVNTTVRDKRNVWQGAIKEIEIAAKTNIVEFNLINDLKITSEMVKALVSFELEFEDKLTGKSDKNSFTATVCDENCNEINFVLSHPKISPGFSYEFQVEVVKLETSEVATETTAPVIVSIVYHFLDPKCNDLSRGEEIKTWRTTHESVLNHGLANFVLDIPKNTSSITVSANFFKASKTIEITSFPSKAREYLKLTLINERPRIDDEILVNVELTDEIIEFHWAVHKGSNIMLYERFQVLYDQEAEVSFKATADLMPVIRFIAYYVHSSGEIVHSEIEIMLVDESRNYLSVTVSPSHLTPGTNCTISINASSETFVSLTAIDQRALIDGAKIKTSSLYSDQLRFAPSNFAARNKANFVDLFDFNSVILTEPREEICLSLRLGSDSDEDSNEKDSNEKVDSTEKEDGYFVENANVFDDHQEDDGEKLRRLISDTWLFETFKTDNKGQLTLYRTVPDTITTWVVAGVSLNDIAGLTFADHQLVTVTQQFFIKTNLPYSIRYGEILKVDVVIVSQSLKNSEVEVVLTRNDEQEDFEFIEKISTCSFLSRNNITQTERVKILSNNSAVSVSFLIRLLKTGNVKLRFKASVVNSSIIDEVEENLIVENDTSTKYINKAHFIDLRKRNNSAKGFNLLISEEAIWKSIWIEGAVIGNLLGSSLLDAEHLIQKPTGSSDEKVVLKYMQSMISLKYLSQTDQLKSITKAQLEKHLKDAYKYLIERRNPDDGSFNFKGHGKLKSIWLTAYVTRCLGQMIDMMEINETYIKTALDFLQAQQIPADIGGSLTGGFVEFGNNGKADIALTAFVVIAFLENSGRFKGYEDVSKNALTFIDHHISSMKSNYDIAISCYALSLAKHEEANTLLQFLKARKMEKDGKQFWELSFNNENKTLLWDNSDQIEMVSYALLSFIKAGEQEEILPIIMWLISQIKLKGVSLTKKDPAIVANALAEVARIFFSSTIDMDIALHHSRDEETTIHVDKSNALSPIRFKMPPSVRDIFIQANGTGFVMLETLYSYDTFVDKFEESFELSVKVEPTKDEKLLHLDICTHYLFDENDEDATKFVSATMEVKLPSGYVFDSDFDNILTAENIKSVETENRKTTIRLKFENLTNKQVRIHLNAIQEFKVEQIKRSTVKIYQDQDQEKRTVEYYTTKGSQYCEN